LASISLTRIGPESSLGFSSDKPTTNRLIDGTEPSDTKEPFIRTCLLEFQHICVANPYFVVQLKFLSGVLRGICASCVTAQEIKE
jgi:hypothetical protein